MFAEALKDKPCPKEVLGNKLFGVKPPGVFVKSLFSYLWYKLIILRFSAFIRACGENVSWNISVPLSTGKLRVIWLIRPSGTKPILLAPSCSGVENCEVLSTIGNKLANWVAPPPIVENVNHKEKSGICKSADAKPNVSDRFSGGVYPLV